MRPLHTVQPGTPLTTALGMLLEAGVSVLPVVDEACLALNLTVPLFVWAELSIIHFMMSVAWGALSATGK